MRLVCDGTEFAGKLGSVAAVVPTRSPKPVLNNVLLRHDGERLELFATDLEIAMQAELERFETEPQPWQALLPAAQVLSIVREIGAGQLELEASGERLVVQGDGSRFELLAGDPEEYPAFEAEDEGEPVALEGEALAGMLRRCLIAVAVDSHDFSLEGVLFDLRPERLRLVATDGNRMSLCEHVFETPVGLESARVVPTKAATLLQRMADGDGEAVSLRFGARWLVAERGPLRMRAQLVQGRFPPYEQVVPTDLAHTVAFELQPFVSALRRATLVSDKESHAVALRFGHELLTLRGGSPQLGHSEVQLPIAYEDDPVALPFNARLLLDALRVVSTDRVEFHFGDIGQPVVLEEPAAAFRYVVMPLEPDVAALP
ncbi:MAG: DNA polymerase III subunit beta [Planctomycetota bacterium]|nr:MAG: DNA polymerase III subunit beta [Planctomycetota bacterium]